MYNNPYTNYSYGYPPYNAGASYQNLQPATQNTAQMSRTGIEVMYATESEATNYLVEPNRKILFIITDKPMQIFKATDSMGISTSKRYKTEELDNSPTEQQAPDFDPKEFVKRDDLSGFITSDVLDSKISSLSSAITKQIDDIKKSIKIQEILKENK